VPTPDGRGSRAVVPRTAPVKFQGDGAQHGLERVGRLGTGGPATRRTILEPGPRAEWASPSSVRGSTSSCRRAESATANDSSNGSARKHISRVCNREVRRAVDLVGNAGRRDAAGRDLGTAPGPSASSVQHMGECGHLLHLPAVVQGGAGQAQQSARLVCHPDGLVHYEEACSDPVPSHHVAATHGRSTSAPDVACDQCGACGCATERLQSTHHGHVRWWRDRGADASAVHRRPALSERSGRRPASARRSPASRRTLGAAPPAFPYDAARAGSLTASVSAAARSATYCPAAAGVPVPSVGLLDRHQPAGLAVDDHLRDAAGRGGDHRGLARHRLEVHDAERLVDRGAGEHGRGGEQRDDVGAGEHLGDPHHAAARLRESVDQARAPRPRSPGCPGAPAHSTSWTSGGSWPRPAGTAGGPSAG
jgi:hypothetical protein